MLVITSGAFPRRLRQRRPEAEDLQRQAIERIRQRHNDQLAALAARGWRIAPLGTREERGHRRIRFLTHLHRERRTDP